MAAAKKRTIPPPAEKLSDDKPTKNVSKTEKAAKAAKPKKDTSKPSAATRFRELIMAGKLTDDEIFVTMQKEYGLDKSKRGYVQWYRKDLEKQGQKPPKPVEK